MAFLIVALLLVTGVREVELHVLLHSAATAVVPPLDVARAVVRGGNAVRGATGVGPPLAKALEGVGTVGTGAAVI